MNALKSKFNGYLVSAICVVGASFYLLQIDSLEPYFEKFSNLTGIEEQYAWTPIAGICVIALAVIMSMLHSRMKSPLREIANQCVDGQVDGVSKKVQSRETRVICEYIRQRNERANKRATQITKMESDLFAMRKERDRALQKVEEQEDVISSYSRIRTELSLDNTNLRRENRNLEEQVLKLKQKLPPTSGGSSYSYADQV